MDNTPDSVKQLLASEDYGDRISAVNQMRQLDPADALGLLCQAAEDNHARVRYAAVSQIANVGNQDRERVLALLKKALLTDAEVDVRAAAADSLGALQFTEAFDDLKIVYEETADWLLQFSILAALGELGDPRSFDLLKDALSADNQLFRTAAIGALGELENAEAIPLLLPFVEDSDWQTRLRLAQALSHFDEHPEVKQALEKLAGDEFDAVAQAAQAHL
ncbi:MAG: HEAT repeat domain-containing protein [Leptolyngbyaceae cyanobacterium SM1_1_3]|nr:HEAT repeat domain-containing protein [Leptolyngbyaceae cyanobacterium SM1_1_3]NJN03843.1 HEAT repeat domain-containing protein [Leptolyngbyaceae cyanobacterium RM1_1_2]NJO10025.1 HEAT repeat domain-containing protein [Leptolyngbyaceae cyanobacterium SL_1_1]